MTAFGQINYVYLTYHSSFFTYTVKSPTEFPGVKWFGQASSGSGWQLFQLFGRLFCLSDFIAMVANRKAEFPAVKRFGQAVILAVWSPIPLERLYW